MKRIVPLFVLVLALAAPVAAFADDPPVQPAGPSAQLGGHGGPHARVRQARRRLRAALRHCKQARGAERQACLQRIIDRLEQLKSRIDGLEAKIRDKCPGATPATDADSASAQTPVARDRCSRAPRLLARLERMKSRLDKLETRIRTYLSGDSPSGSDTTSSDESSADADSIASLEAQLNAVASQAG